MNGFNCVYSCAKTARRFWYYACRFISGLCVCFSGKCGSNYDSARFSIAICARRQAPSAGPTSAPVQYCSSYPVTSANICRQNGLRQPPPMRVILVGWTLHRCTASMPWASAKLTPSITARANAGRECCVVNPKKTPFALALLCGVRSPARYGKKNTGRSSKFVTFYASRTNSLTELQCVNFAAQSRHDAQLKITDMRCHRCGNAWQKLCTASLVLLWKPSETMK